VVVAVLTALALLVGCGVAAAHLAGPTSGDRVVIVVGGTADEPRPTVTAAAQDLLETAANSTDVTDGANSRSSVALVSSADGVVDRSIVLTPRRADGSVEHGLSRKSLIDRNIQSVVSTVASVTASRPGLDLLSGISNAVRGIDPGTLVVVSNGLSTSGGLDLRQVGWHADATTIAHQLSARDLLPRLAGWHVLFTGLGAVAGRQPPLPNPVLDTLVNYWRAVCRAAGALTCTVDQSRIPAVKSASTVAMPIVPVPDVTSVVGPDGKVHTTVSDGALGFAGNSAALTPDAQDLLRSLAGDIVMRLAGQARAAVTVTGYAADPPGSTDRGRKALAELRANAVKAALADDGVTNRITASGVGTQPGVTAMVHGRFDEHVASTMRRVVITY
jgi:outer membrane protein OmpA-like peptidoglycan-associated protein